MNKKVVFVDCFDTVLLRTVPAEKVKYLWAEEMSKAYSEIEQECFYRAFLSAENRLRYKNEIKFGVKECEISDIAKTIFNRLLIYNKISNKHNEQDFIESSKNAYLKIEKQVLYPNQKVIKLLKDFKNQGSKIFVVSDFYCGSEILKEFLNNLKIDNLFDKVYVSCDCYKTKESGSLYTKVLKENNLNVDDVIMIGDNLHSDNSVPQSMGIKTIKIKERDNSFKVLEKIKNITIPKEFKQIFNNTKTNNFANASFSLYVFVKRLVEKLKTNKTKNVFFLSREGQFLKKIFDFYLEYFNISDIKSHYLQVSRNSILVAGLEDLQTERFETVINETGQISIIKFLKTLGFAEDLIKDITKELKSDVNIDFKNFLESKAFKELKANEKFVNYYNEFRLKQNNAFSNYLKTFNVDFNEGLNVVDVGWKGTMQDLLVKYFNSNIKVTGFYLGYNGLGDESLNNVKYGLLYSDSPYSSDLKDRIYKLDYLHYEQFLRASTNRVSGYNINQKNVEIVYDNSIDDAGFYKEHIKLFQEDMFDKFCAICKACKDYSNINIEEICLFMHAKMLKKIDTKAYKFITICNNSHYDSFSRIGFSSKGEASIKGLVLYVLRKIKLKLKLILNRI